MQEPGFSDLVIVMAVAFTAPFLLGLAPRLRLPSVVLEIVAGIVIGPSVLGWVEVDRTISVLALIGLAVLLFLAGLEIDFGPTSPRPLWAAALRTTCLSSFTVACSARSNRWAPDSNKVNT